MVSGAREAPTTALVPYLHLSLSSWQWKLFITQGAELKPCLCQAKNESIEV